MQQKLVNENAKDFNHFIHIPAFSLIQTSDYSIKFPVLIKIKLMEAYCTSKTPDKQYNEQQGSEYRPSSPQIQYDVFPTSFSTKICINIWHKVTGPILAEFE